MKIIAEPVRPATELRKSVPPNVAAALAKALEKLPADRFDSARAFSDALGNTAFDTQGALVTGATRGHARRWVTDARTLATIALGVIGIAIASTLRSGLRSGSPIEYDVGLPDTAGLMTVSQDAGFAVSPAGDFVVYETVRNGRSELWYRSLLDAAVRRIPGTDGGSQPVLSPDGNRIAFFRLADGGWTVEVVPVEGGSTTTVGRGVSSIRKLAWPPGDRILLLLSDAGQARWLDPERGPVASVPIPYCEGQSAIPGSNALLCGGGEQQWGSRIELGDTTVRRQLWRADSDRVFGSSFHLVDGRYLTYLSSSAELLAAPVDIETGRVGRAVRMATGIGLADFTGNGSYAISTSGTLVYAQRDNRAVGHLVHLTDRGIDTLPVGREAFTTFAYSPDGSRLAAVVQGLDGMELRIYDLSSGRYRTWVRRAILVNPVWSPGGDQLLFGDTDSLFLGSPDRSDAPVFLLHLPGSFEMHRWLPDGRVFGRVYNPNLAIAFRIDRRPITIDTLVSNNGFAFPSADGRWLGYADAAYTEAWVEPLPGDGRRFQVASGNLGDPQWLSARELGVSMIDGGRTRIERVTIDPAANPPARNRGVWAEAPDFRETNGPSFAMAPGGGVIYLRGAVDRPASYLRVVPHWVDRMKRAVDEANR
jgi:serine/threonine-protein kinase